MTGYNGQTIVCTLHQMCIAKYTNRVKALRQMLWILANNSLWWIRIQYYYDEAALIIFYLWNQNDKNAWIVNHLHISNEVYLPFSLVVMLNAACDHLFCLRFTRDLTAVNASKEKNEINFTADRFFVEQFSQLGCQNINNKNQNGIYSTKENWEIYLIKLMQK